MAPLSAAVAASPSASVLLPLAALGVAAAALVLFRGRIAGAGADFEIRYRPGGRPTTIRGRVPAAKHGDVRTFFEADLRPAGPVTVRGTWGPPPARMLQLRIAGTLDAGRRQRVRNFLLDLLG